MLGFTICFIVLAITIIPLSFASMKDHNDYIKTCEFLEKERKRNYESLKKAMEELEVVKRGD